MVALLLYNKVQQALGLCLNRLSLLETRVSAMQGQGSAEQMQQDPAHPTDAAVSSSSAGAIVVTGGGGEFHTSLQRHGLERAPSCGHENCVT